MNFLFLLTLLELFFLRIQGDVLQTASGPTTIGTSVSRQSLDRPWYNLSFGLDCSVIPRAFSSMWAFSPTQQLKITNLSLNLPIGGDVTLIGIYIEITGSVNRVPTGGVKENRISMFLPDGSEWTTPVQTYTGVGGGWQTIDTKLIYPLANQDALWNISKLLNISVLQDPNFGFGLVVQNGQSDTTCMVTCLIVSVFWKSSSSTTGFVSTSTTNILTSTTTTMNSYIISSTSAPTFSTTIGSSKNTQSKIMTTTTKIKKPQTILDMKSETTQLIFAISIFGFIMCLIMIMIIICTIKYRKRYKETRDINKVMAQGNVNAYQQLSNKTFELNETKKYMGPDKIENVLIGSELGKGSNGKVYFGKMNDSIDVAIKEYYSQEITFALETEIGKLRSISHPNLIKIYGIFKESEERIYLVMQFHMHRSLFDYYQNKGCEWIDMLPLYGTRIVYYTAVALEKLHSLNIIHRNLTPKQILISIENDLPTPILTDFAMSKASSELNNPYSFNSKMKKENSEEKEEQNFQSVAYQAPEVIISQLYSEESDVFSLGMIMWYVFASGENPYKHKDKSEILTLKSTDKLGLTKPSKMSLDLYALMNKCLEITTSKRFDSKIITYKLKGHYDDLENMYYSADKLQDKDKMPDWNTIGLDTKFVEQLQVEKKSDSELNDDSLYHQYHSSSSEEKKNTIPKQGFGSKVQDEMKTKLLHKTTYDNFNDLK